MIESKPRVSVIGGGSWATAIMKMLTENLDEVCWWMRSESKLTYIKEFGRNPRYLPSVKFDTQKILLTTDLAHAMQWGDIIIMATPSAFVYDLFKDFDCKGYEDKVMVSAIKGIIAAYHAIPARYFHKQFGVPYDSIAMISGPCHAEEVAMERLSYLTIACSDLSKAEIVAKVLATRYIHTTTSDDLFGTELSAVMKNVFAVASGICHGLGYGDNFQAVLMSNSILEIERFVDAVNPIHRDVKTSAYLGDLLVTGYSQFSRNRTFGSMIGKGYSVKSAMMEMNMVAEGYYAAKSIIEMNKKFQVDLPICHAVYNIVYDNIAPSIEMSILSDKLV
ncbi:MAG: NAD(P)H-dependent glycerol-3-phosphate dehydrogenase [Cryomorphaceae bacterium]|nr:MAG: NAD(P)H-dependent glycerol-3-phosphate dehydrogenase [Cryomorphaceae bacterium]